MPLPLIESNTNPIVKQFRSLHQRKGRLLHRLFLGEGPKIINEALMSNYPLVDVLVLNNGLHTLSPLLEAIQQHQPQAHCYVVNQKVLEAVSDTKSPQSIVASITLPAENNGTIPTEGFGLYLDSLQDPGNVGTMMRSADALGAKWVFLGGSCADPYAPKTIRAAMGSTFHLPIYRQDDGISALHAFCSHGFFLVAADLAGQSELPVSLPPKTVLMIGNEGQGLCSEALDIATVRYRLPMRGHAESLNASACAAILLYECADRIFS